MTSSKFTEHFSGSNKVHYPISNRNNFTVKIMPVVGQQNYITVAMLFFKNLFCQWGQICRNLQIGSNQ